MTQTAFTHAPVRLATGVVALLTLLAWIPPAARAAEYFVNNASASCSNTGAGTMAEPFCSISAALVAHHEPGAVITVLPGTYREQVTVPASGVAGSPITLRAQPGAGPVVVDGTNDFSDPALWSPVSGDVWLAASVATPPRQVFADDQRLTPSTAPPGSLPSRSFTFVAGSGLYVNAGGGNPGTHRTQVGGRLRGFFASGRSFIVIRGFTVTRCEDRCIQLTNSSNVLVEGNTLTFSGGIGLQANRDSADRIVGNRSSNNADHGFSLLNGTVETTVEGNEAFDNADPDERRANGLFVAGSRNVIRGNRWHHNQDSGEQFSPGSVDNLSIQNRSWANGDHGYDHNRATGTLHLNDVAYANFKDGFSIEGSSTGTHLFNCIAIENGVTTGEYNLFVDSLSTAGLLSNDNVLWNSGPQPPVRVASSVYPTVSGYSAGRNQDTRSVQANPLFVAAANGDFHLAPGSPAIDNANSSVANWPSTDAEGRARLDDPGMPNRGIGPVTFADRGALEFQGSSPGGNQPPVARLTATPSSGTAPLNVRLDASASSDAGGRIVSYFFAFGDGNTVGPQASATASHGYAAGRWTATVTVTDDQGATATASTTIVVSEPAGNVAPTARVTVNPANGTAPLKVHANANASSDPDGQIVSYRFEFGDGATAGPQSSPSAQHTYAAGSWTLKVTVTDNGGATASATASVVVGAATANRPPSAALAVEPSSGIAPLAVRASAAASVDSDGQIVSYRFDFGDGTRVGPQPGAEAQHTYGPGHWTVRVDVTDDDGATASSFVNVNVSSPPSNLVANSSFETNTTGWAGSGEASIRRVGGGHSGGFSLLASAPLLGLASYGVTDQPNWVQRTAGVGTRYHVRAWVRTELGVGIVGLVVREFTSGSSFTTRSSTIQLGTGWAALDLDVTTRLAGSALDVSIMNAPSALGTAFRVDDVSIMLGTGAPALASAQDDAAPEPEPTNDPFLAPGVHPNPVGAGGARIVFATRAAGPTQVAIFDLAGRVVRQLDGDPAAAPGVQGVAFDARGDDGRRLPGGVYYYQVRSPGQVSRGRLVVVE